MGIIQTMLLALVVVALAVAGGAWAFQTWGIYRFQPVAQAPADFGRAGVRVVEFRSEDGSPIHAWVVDPGPGHPVILSFYGNSAAIGPSMARLMPLVADGYGLVVMEYRGSGATRGKPGEAAFAKDARALYDGLDELLGRPVAPAERVLHGFSLGAGVGSRLAATRPFAAVILEASPLRTCLYYQDRYFGLPFCSVLWDERYDIVDFVREIPAPKLFVHGALDAALPVERARLLAETAPPPATYVELPGGHHADLADHGLIPAIEAFLAGIYPAR